MWTRAELKTKARAVLKNSYWESVLAYLVYGAISVGASMVSSFVPFGPILTTIFLMLPLSVGLHFFFMQNQIAPSRMQNIFFAFRNSGYMKIVASTAWMYLFISLWSLIAVSGFIILIIKIISAFIPYFMADRFMLHWPTIDSSWIPTLVACGVMYLAGLVILCIKGLSYSMTGYILTDNPEIGYERALKLSIAMTYGHKWHMFVLYLSFIGWGLLTLLTFGIGSLFLAPYITSTSAELYVKLRDNAINSGLTSQQELNVYLK